LRPLSSHFRAEFPRTAKTVHSTLARVAKPPSVFNDLNFRASFREFSSHQARQKTPLIQRLGFNSTAVNLLFSSRFGSQSVGKPKFGYVTEGQRAAIVASTIDWARAQGHGGERASVNINTCTTQEQRAAMAGVSKSTQRTAERVAKASLEKIQEVADETLDCFI
jgi:hypothetical protein